MLEPIKTLCKYCKYYEPVKGKRHGYCRKPYSHYEGLKVNGAHKGADRCFEKRNAVVNYQDREGETSVLDQ